MIHFKSALFSFFIFATIFTQAQAVEKGNILIDGYYGVGSISNAALRTLAKEALKRSDVIDLELSNQGPYGGKVEYMITDMIGAGLEVNYGTNILDFKGEISDSVSVAAGVDGIYDFKITKNVLRIMPRVSVHFGKSDALDSYASLALGYKGRTLLGVSNNPTDRDFRDLKTNAVYLPIGFRIAGGVRYYFADFIGVNAELGFFGGPLITAGLSLKI